MIKGISNFVLWKFDFTCWKRNYTYLLRFNVGATCCQNFSCHQYLHSTCLRRDQTSYYICKIILVEKFTDSICLNNNNHNISNKIRKLFVAAYLSNFFGLFGCWIHNDNAWEFFKLVSVFLQTWSNKLSLCEVSCCLKSYSKIFNSIQYVN